LRSLLSQSLSDERYEILVIDDGSTDLTPYALTQFISPSRSNIKVITNPNNLGLPASINRGIKAASGEFIVRVDSDDFVNENFLLFLLEYLLLNPDSDAVACDYLSVTNNEEVIERHYSDSSPIACGIMFRKSQLFDIGLYDEKFHFREEEELRSRFDRRYVLEHLRLPLYRYRRHDSNMTLNVEGMNSYKVLLNEKTNQLSDK
jgi:glycosyltransferase involved in cell wall biosynthesis